MVTACKVYPEQLPNAIRSNPKRSAEVQLYDLFRSQLGSGWVVFYSVAWLAPIRGGSPRDGETDFIVAHPTKGILLIEVKGGRIRFDGAYRQWISTDREGIDHPIDPFEQVLKSKHALKDKLKALPQWKGRWIDLGHAVAFPHNERPKQAITPDAPPEIIIGADDLNDIADRIDQILGYYRSGSSYRVEHGSRLVEDLTRLLAPTTELRNPLALQTAEDEREIVRLTEEQFRLLDRMRRNRRMAIGGCAGAGKTFLAVEKAKRLAGEGFRTLLTCYNRPLANHLATVTAGTENLEVTNFHALCHQFAKEAGLSLPMPTDRAFQDEYPDLLQKAASMLPDRGYDAIIVDEGQDFKDTWWIALESCLRDNKQDVFYIFYDDNQSLYQGRSSLPGDLYEYLLDENVRNTRSIFEALSKHYQGETPAEPRGPTGRTIEQLEYDSTQDMGRLLAKVLHRLLVQEGFTNRDLVVLTPRALDRSDLLSLKLPQPLRLVKEEPEPNKPREVLCSTIHSFKGLERRVVIVAELEAGLDGQIKPELYYVAFSRPRTHLIVLGKRGTLSRVLPTPI